MMLVIVYQALTILEPMSKTKIFRWEAMFSWKASLKMVAMVLGKVL